MKLLLSLCVQSSCLQLHIEARTCEPSNHVQWCDSFIENISMYLKNIISIVKNIVNICPSNREKGKRKKS